MKINEGAVNYWPITVAPTTPPSLAFTFAGGKQLRFRRADDGRITVEYDPADLTEAAQAVITEVERLLRR